MVHVFIGSRNSVEGLFCPQLKDKLVKLFYQNFLLLWKSFEVCVYLNICIYIFLVLFPTFCSERTAYALMNATAVVCIKISYLLLISSFKRAVDAKISSNSILHQMLLNF